MKLLVTLTFITLYTGLAAQDTTFRMQKIVIVDSTTKTQLFERARLWMNDYYKSSKDVLQVSDKESGELVGKPIMNISYPLTELGHTSKVPVHVDYTVRIIVKDGKYKVEAYNFYNKEYFGLFTASDKCPVKFMFTKKSKSDKSWQDCKKNIAAEFEDIAISLASYMSQTKTSKKDDF